MEDAAKALKDKGFDIEVVEMHHRYKKDSPSGTAVKIVDILKEATGIQKVIYGREGIYENGRPSDEIAVLLYVVVMLLENTLLYLQDLERE